MGNKHILVVDDSAWARQVVRITLKHSAYEVIEASNDLEAMAILDRQPVDLIICDCNLANAAETGFIDAVRQKDEYRNIPVVMCFPKLDASSLQQNQPASADAWIAKPFQPSHLLGVVSRLLPA